MIDALLLVIHSAILDHDDHAAIYSLFECYFAAAVFYSVTFFDRFTVSIYSLNDC